MTIYFFQSSATTILIPWIFLIKCIILNWQGEKGDKGERGLTTTFKGDKFATGIIEGPPGPPGPPGNTIHSIYFLALTFRFETVVQPYVAMS